MAMKSRRSSRRFGKCDVSQVCAPQGGPGCSATVGDRQVFHRRATSQLPVRGRVARPDQRDGRGRRVRKPYCRVDCTGPWATPFVPQGVPPDPLSVWEFHDATIRPMSIAGQAGSGTQPAPRFACERPGGGLSAHQMTKMKLGSDNLTSAALPFV